MYLLGIVLKKRCATRMWSEDLPVLEMKPRASVARSAALKRKRRPLTLAVSRPQDCIMTAAHKEALCVAPGASPEVDVEIHRCLRITAPTGAAALAMSFQDFECAMRSALCSEHFTIDECAALAASLATSANVSAASFSDSRLAGAFGTAPYDDAESVNERPQFLHPCLPSLAEEIWGVLSSCDCVTPANAPLEEQAYCAVVGDALQFALRILCEPAPGETALTCAQMLVGYGRFVMLPLVGRIVPRTGHLPAVSTGRVSTKAQGVGQIAA